MAKGTTNTGFNFEVDENIAFDYEFLEMVSEVDDNPLQMPKILEKILGKEQTKALKEHVRDKNGVVNVLAINQEIEDIFNNVKNVKK